LIKGLFSKVKVWSTFEAFTTPKFEEKGWNELSGLQPRKCCI
jgi:hypothetical protein